MTLLKFMSDSPFLGFILICAAYYLCKAALFTIRRLLRSLNIAMRGWPPAHLDADGDFVNQCKPATDNQLEKSWNGLKF